MDILVIATNNAHKVDEIKAILGDRFEVRSLNDVGLTVDWDESGKTFADNARIKAQAVWGHGEFAVLADDSGLEVDGLHGEPGVYSSRYAGEHAADIDNTKLMLKNLDASGDVHRKARFRCTLIYKTKDGDEIQFDGICEGHISKTLAGSGGFGYDPVFVPEGFNKTLAELPAEEKNRISHRSNALAKFVDYASSAV